MSIKKIHEKFLLQENIFQCPICKSEVEFKNINSLVCKKNHCFDLSKQNYINFAPNQKKIKYTKELFENRRFIFESEFYNKFLLEIKILIEKYFPNKKINILDVGCGEGYYSSRLENHGNIFGMDIVKEAIISAGKENKNINWLVGDLANIPFKKNSIDLILNILTPANYKEFERIIKKEGLIFKVIPNKNYLIQLRNLINFKEEYSNENVVSYFEKNINLLEIKNINYTLDLNEKELEGFLKMTPMMFNININDFDISLIKNITIDLDIIVGKF